MPRLPETHHSTTETATAVQLKVKSAAIAAAWKTTIAIVVDQLMPVRLCITSAIQPPVPVECPREIETGFSSSRGISTDYQQAPAPFVIVV
jgi:hypothetical protein